MDNNAEEKEVQDKLHRLIEILEDSILQLVAEKAQVEAMLKSSDLVGRTHKRIDLYAHLEVERKKMGTTIRNLLRQRGYRQKDFAEKIGISENYLCLIINGKRRVSVDILNEIAKILEVPLWSLILLAMYSTDSS